MNQSRDIIANSFFGGVNVTAMDVSCAGRVQLAQGAATIKDTCFTGDTNVVLCTDGLWNYFPGALDLARVARAAGPGASTARIARAFVNHALARGGEDNVSVAVYAHGAREVTP